MNWLDIRVSIKANFLNSFLANSLEVGLKSVGYHNRKEKFKIAIYCYKNTEEVFCDSTETD